MSNQEAPSALQTFLQAMQARDVDGLIRASAGMTEEVTLNSPIVARPFQGKQQVLQVLKALLSIMDSFAVRDILSSSSGAFAALVSITSGETKIGGVYYATFEEDKISSMTIQWRALEEIVQMQNKIAPLIGGQALTLVPKS